MNTTPRRIRLTINSLVLLLGSLLASSEAAPTIEVYKSPTCGCCKG